ncbi:MAG: aspartate aminotransferase family protein [Thermomicrobiales bacterium]
MTTPFRHYERSLELFEDARALIPEGAQTNSKRPTAFAYGAYPIYLESASGCRVQDIDGNEFIDLVGGLGPISLGYAYPDVDDAIRAQLPKGIISGLLSPLEVDVAKLLIDLVPCAEQVRYFKGGGEATAAAARVARRFTGRELILNCGYRGWPDTWAAAANDGGVPKALGDAIQSFAFNDREGFERLVLSHPGQVAAIAIDTQVTPPESGYLAWLRDLAHEIGALLIFDEVVTGFRLANGGAQELFGVTPDLAVFAKGIANGMPLAVVAGRSEVMAAMTDALISITYGGEALSLAAAKATLTIYRDQPVVETLWKRGRQLRDGLTRAAEMAHLPLVVEGFDPMTAMRFAGLSQVIINDAWSFLLQEMAERGVLLRRGGLNFISYSHQERDIDTVIEAATEVFAELSPLLTSDRVGERLCVRETASAFRSFA